MSSAHLTVEPKARTTRLGFGLGLRNVHFDQILETLPAIDWFEAISENFMDSGGRPRAVLRQIAARYPVVLHGVSMSIGSTDPLNRDYLRKLKSLADEIDARWVSDHLCWTGVLGLNSHDLLPLPLTDAVLAHVSSRVHAVQDYLQRPLVLENPSTYLRFRQSHIDEPDFLRELCKQTGCQLLLDVNNVYVSCFNAGTNPRDYLRKFPFEHVIQMHLAGHQHCGTHIVDTHDQPVCESVWELFHEAWLQTGGAATLLEWDGDIPSLERLQAELERARQWAAGASATRVDANATAVTSAPTDALSTPINFMVPAVMGDQQLISA